MEGRWTIYVCTGCGLPTGRHNNCDAKRQATPVVPCDETAIDHAARMIETEVNRRNEHYGLDNWNFKEVVEFVIAGLAASDT